MVAPTLSKRRRTMVEPAAPSVRSDRRGFLRAAGVTGAGALAAACAPQATPAAPSSSTAPAPTTAAWEKEWEQLVAAAKQEGEVAIFVTGVTRGPRKVADIFEAAFPGVKVDLRQYN